MPIKNLTDNHQYGHGLPRIGTLYKGDEKPENGNRPGKDLDHFRFEPEPQFEWVAEQWREMYADQPTEFAPVFLFGSTADEVFETWMEEWSATALLHRCDGEQQYRRFDKSIGEYSSAHVKCEAPQCQCKRTGRLRLIMPNFIETTGVLGYIAITTHSIYDILSLHRYLSDVAQMYGRLDGVPFVFGRAKHEVSVPKPKEPGTRMNTTKSLLYLHVLPDFTREHLARRIAPLPEAPALTDGLDDVRIINMETGEIGQTTNGNPTLDRATMDENGESAERPDWYDGFLAWVGNQADMRKLEMEHIEQALSAADGWQTNKKMAMAAVIAYHCEYNPNTIDIFTSTAGFDPTVYEYALGIANKYAEVAS